jgi:predicted DCC family thiol-disulfide oxidoreductase YuxK
MKRDIHSKFKFAASQSAKGQELIAKYNLTKEQYKTVVLIQPKGNILMKSTASLHILHQISFPYNYLYYLIVFPEILRDLVYNFISKYRYSLFGKNDSCRLPSEEEKLRFL